MIHVPSTIIISGRNHDLLVTEKHKSATVILDLIDTMQPCNLQHPLCKVEQYVYATVAQDLCRVLHHIRRAFYQALVFHTAKIHIAAA